MKAVAITAEKKLEVKEISEPTQKSGSVLVDVKRAGICGSDIHYWEMGEPKGLVMGHEFSGVVTNPGSRKDLKVGDRVTALPISPCNKCEACLTGNPQYCRETWNKAVGLSLTNPGAYAPKLSVRPDMVIKLPNKVSDEEGAMVEPAAVGLHAVHLAKVKVGSKVLVVGGGIIGLMSAMFSKLQGASLVAVSETNAARGKNAVKQQVADVFLDAKSNKFIELTNTISEGGFDVVIDCSGNSVAVNSALMAVKPGGIVVLAGVSMLPISFASVVAVMSELTVQGAIGYTKEEFETCVKLMETKQISVKKFVSKTVALEEVQDAFLELTNGKTNSIKILIDPNKVYTPPKTIAKKSTKQTKKPSSK